MGHLDPGLFFWALATFAGLLLLLSRFAFKPLRQLLEKREQSIRGAIDEAKQARDEAKAILAQHQAQLMDARNEARRVVDEGNRIVVEKQRESEARAKEHADQLIERARAEIERETRKGLDDLKGTLASLSVRIAHQVIRENLDDNRHEELANQFIERLKKTRHASQGRQD